MSRVLVTGSAGFIGSHLVDYLIEMGHEVWGVDDLSGGSRANITPEAAKRFFLGNLNDEYTQLRIKKLKPELVYHLAAWAHEGLSQFVPKKITENNYNAFLGLLTASLQGGCKRFVVCSSMSVYGSQQPPFDETMQRKPADIYAIAKTAMEEACEVMSKVHGFDYTIIRPHNVYGERQNMTDPYRNVIGIFMNRVMQGKPPIIYGDGEQTRAFSYIDDVVPYIAQAGFLHATKGEVVNVGPLEEYSINTLARSVLDAFGSALEPMYMSDRPLEVKHAYCTNQKAKDLLGYQTTMDLQEGIGRMAVWAKEQGPKPFNYFTELELTHNAPETWTKKKM